MFLGELTKNEKKLFWEIANCLVHADDKIADDEVEMMNEYKRELRENDYIIEKPVCTINEILANKDDIGVRKKKIIFFELLGLAYADKEFAESEKVLLQNVKMDFNISEEDEKKMLDIIDKISDAYLDLSKILKE